MKNWLIGKDPDAGKDWRQEEKGMTEDEMVGWHHQRDGNTSLSKLWGLVMDREARCAAFHGVTKCRTQLSNWTELLTAEKSYTFPPWLEFTIFSVLISHVCSLPSNQVGYQSTAWHTSCTLVFSIHSLQSNFWSTFCFYVLFVQV